jgi:hypothetical protein
LIFQVDFQLSLYSSPGIDLQYFFNTSLRDDILIENEEKLLKEYLRTLTLTMVSLGCKTKPPTMDELKKIYIDRALFGMIASFTVLPIILIDKDNCMNLNEIMNSLQNSSSVYGGKAFRKAMSRRLTKFDQMGLLD